VTHMLGSLLRGAAAGAAGTTALNAATYLDMVISGRSTSGTPEQTIEALSERVGVDIPGNGETRENRLQALGALGGLATGVGVGAVLGLGSALGWRPGLLGGSLVSGSLAMAGGNVPMARLGISDPRQWSANDWVSDVVPHLVFGLVTYATLTATDPRR
jgi:hypothetical protein